MMILICHKHACWNRQSSNYVCTCSYHPASLPAKFSCPPSDSSRHRSNEFKWEAEYKRTEWGSEAPVHTRKMSRKSVQFCSLRLSTAKKCTSGPFPSSRSQEGQVCLFDITKRKRMSFNSWTTGFTPRTTKKYQEFSIAINYLLLPVTSLMDCWQKSRSSLRASQTSMTPSSSSCWTGSLWGKTSGTGFKIIQNGLKFSSHVNYFKF